ncbi:antibiotic biosynthesis monooxygenase [Kordiimonas sp. SCSIO 12610]|uniref:antibiotic biosynthesis monooxygenase family protein n=1 Tax=Kordiimonas sp. SCSIO 12610 TaxID=2829597 RepID=UPI0021099F7F|nr:antibiotic biosynthesis monooxygenase [Kordiimonas sp. SCSIO 12610]UTW56371.1 antibiotic biosynthesis monooxygenase [Kordiimonas sp. SCSIO 12610]
MTISPSDKRLSHAPEPPYMAVIFTSIQNDGPLDGYSQTAEDMVRLAAEQSGYIGYESAHDRDGTGITVSYWENEASIKKWKQQADHMTAQKAGRNKWYRAYITRIARVDRHYAFENT